jgi:lysophospholipase L1-like esterase
MQRTRTLTTGLLLVAGLAAVAPAALGQQQPAPVPSCPELARALSAVVRNDTRLRDWADLARYRQANATLSAPRADEARVVFMGDSITDMWQQPRFGGFFPGKPYIDRGISGQTTAQMLVRFRPDVLALQPSVVLILAGVNDIAGNTGPTTDEEIEGNLASMSELARANGVRVVLASILPVSAYHHRAGDPSPPQTTIRPMARITAVNDWVRKEASAHGYVYLDYFAAMTDASGFLRAEFSEDDLHPNAKGYAVMAPLAEAAIGKALR